MLAPERFVQWLANNPKADKYGNIYNYHSRSDAHSIALCKMVMEDVLEHCATMREQAAERKIVYGINYPYTWPSGKAKTLDLAVGLATPNGNEGGITLDQEEPVLPDLQFPLLSKIQRGEIVELFFSCEAKAVMTEHGKSKPRLYDELSSSHEIVHQGSPSAIAAGITTVNIATSFVSPLRNKQEGVHEITKHNQPKVAADMVRHLGRLPIRDKTGTVGFDAYCTFLVNLDNQTTPTSWTSQPAPQLGDADHYETFLNRIVTLYTRRFTAI